MNKNTVKLVAVLGLVGSIGILLRAAQNIALPDLLKGLDYPTKNAIIFIPIILEFIGFFGVASCAPRWKNPLLFLIAISTIYYIVFLLNPFYLDEDIHRIRRVLFSIPILIMYYLYWDIDKISKGLSVILLVRITNIIFHLNIGNEISIAYMLVLGYWFFMINKDPNRLKAGLYESDEGEIVTPATDAITTSSTPGIQNRNFPPQLVMWCPNCNMQKKGIKVDFSTDQSLQQPRPCPTCGTNVLQYWAPFSKEQEMRMIIGVSLFMGGVITNIIGSTFALGATSLILALVVIVIGGFIAYTTLNNIKTIVTIPDYATEIPSLEPKHEQGKNMMNFGIRITIGSFVVLALISLLS